MLYTVLGLYDPAELAIDTRLIPSHYGFARLAESSAPSRMPVYHRSDQLGTASVVNVRVC